MKDKGLLLCNYADGLDPVQVQKLHDRLNDYYGADWNILMAPSLEKKTDVEFVLCEETMQFGPSVPIGAVEFKATGIPAPRPVRRRTSHSANGKGVPKRSYHRKDKGTENPS